MKLKALFIILLISFTSASKLTTQLETKTKATSGKLSLISGGLSLGGSVAESFFKGLFAPLVPILIIFSPLILVGIVIAKLLGLISDIFLTIIHSLGTIGSNSYESERILEKLISRRNKVKEFINYGVFGLIAVPIGTVLALPALVLYGLYVVLRAAFDFMIKYLNPKKLFYAIKDLFKSKKKELKECDADFNVDKAEFEEK